MHLRLVWLKKSRESAAFLFTELGTLRQLVMYSVMYSRFKNGYSCICNHTNIYSNWNVIGIELERKNL